MVLGAAVTFWACDDRTALIRMLFHFAVFSDGLHEGAYSKVAHEHSVVASAV